MGAGSSNGPGGPFVRRRSLRERAFPPYAPEVPPQDRVIGALCEDAALVTLALMLVGVGTLIG